MSEITMKLDVDLQPTEKWLKQHTNDVMAAIGLALVGSAETVITLAKGIYVPVVSGNLRSTGQVGDVEVHNGVVSIEMSFGGPAALYAEIVHDAPPDWGQGKNQYLSKPFYIVGRDLPERIRDYVAALY